MENENMNVCQACKQPITTNEIAMACPDCGAHYHENCWNANGGCSTIGCPQNRAQAQYTPVTPVVPVAPVNNTVPPIAPVNNTVPPVAQYPTSYTPPKKKSKAVPIIIAIIALVAIVIGGIFIFNSNEEKKAENAKKDYIANAEKFLDLSIDAGANLEEIADTIQTYWYENIWEDKHGYDINDAIDYALRDKSTEISIASSYDIQMKDLYSQLKSVPDNVKSEDEDDLEDICEAVRDLYNVYTDYYTFATDPSGSYNSFSSQNGDLTDEFISKYNALNNLLN